MNRYLVIILFSLSIAGHGMADEKSQPSADVQWSATQVTPNVTVITPMQQQPDQQHPHEEGKIPYYQDVKHGGWWWYEQDQEKKKEDDKENKPKHFLPSMKDYTNDQLWTMHPKDFQPLLDAFLDKAVQYPTEENVAEYYRIQDIARSRANAFVNVATLVWQKHPELTLVDESPTNTPGRKAMLRLRAGEIHDTLFASSKKDYALIYFYKEDCEFCKAQNGIIKLFVDKYEWQVKKVDVERNTEIAAQFNVSTVPALFLIYRYDDQFIPISAGVTAINEIEMRIYNGIRLLSGQITPEEFNMYEYERGGGFDPSVYDNNIR